MEYPVGLRHVAIYLRKSRADLEAEARGEGETLSKHRRTLMELAKRYHYDIEDIYEEIVSGERILDRPEMQRLLQNVRQGKYTAVLCMDIDRLGRGNMIDQGLIHEAFKTSETLIITPRKVYDLDDELDEEWSEFESFMARRELKIITRRLQRGRRESSREGRHVAKKPPYGYLRGDDLRLYPDPETAPVVRMIFQLAADGYGILRIAKRLTKLGIPTPSGKTGWDRSSVEAILKNPVYRGHIVWGRLQYRKRAAGGYDRKKADKTQWIVHPHAHEPLVDAETFRLYETQLSQKPKVSDKRALSNPLASLVYCSQCGRSMRRLPRTNRPHDMLLCVTPGCDTRGAVFDLVEERIIQSLSEILREFRFDMGQFAHTRDASVDLQVLLGRRMQLQNNIEELNIQRGNLHDLLERKVYDVDTFQERNRIIGERIESAQAELAQLDAQIADTQRRIQRRHELGPRLATALDAYRAAETAKQKNDLLRSVVERIYYIRKQNWTRQGQFELEIRMRF
ncbi:MAG: recombinase family protein [Alicyclobacillaceae bacterium]|nr:recombinase family protein [Alicyclobacillaceae bacterium]